MTHRSVRRASFPLWIRGSEAGPGVGGGCLACLMSSSARLPIGVIDAALDEIAMVDPLFLSTAEKQSALIDVARLEARLGAVKLRLLAAAGDIAEETGSRSTAAWLAEETRDAHGSTRGAASLATVLDSRWRRVGDALGVGVVNLAQTRVIVEALDALPTGLGDDLRVKAEAYLVEKARQLGPRELRVLGRGVLEYLAPEVADEAEHQRLLAEECRARAATRLTFRPRGDGSTDIHARIPDHVAGRLRTYLDSMTSPRRQTAGHPLGEVERLPAARRRGEAFCALLENILDTGLPAHGGTATSVMVTLDLDALISGLGVADTSTGDRITAEQARRLACQARIIPVVLGRKGEVLDLGRSSRLFSPAQRKAMNLRDKECTTVGCSIPAAFCEAHHFKRPWAKGGKTDLADGKLLCPFHHHRAHDPAWIAHHHANGSTTFHRRT